jgi:sRNA-binding regulator protein Hfq
MTATAPLKPPLAPVGGPKAQPRPPDTAGQKPKPVEPDIQLFTRSREQRQQLELRLHDGSEIRGRVAGWGQYTIELVLDTGEPIVVFKNFIATARAGGSR